MLINGLWYQIDFLRTTNVPLFTLLWGEGGRRSPKGNNVAIFYRFSHGGFPEAHVYMIFVGAGIFWLRCQFCTSSMQSLQYYDSKKYYRNYVMKYKSWFQVIRWPKSWNCHWVGQYQTGLKTRHNSALLGQTREIWKRGKSNFVCSCEACFICVNPKKVTNSASTTALMIQFLTRQTSGDLGLFYVLWDEEGGGVCGVYHKQGDSSSKLSHV